MTHPEALSIVSDILTRPDTTWQEKKNILADKLVMQYNIGYADGVDKIIDYD